MIKRVLFIFLFFVLVALPASVKAAAEYNCFCYYSSDLATTPDHNCSQDAGGSSGMTTACERYPETAGASIVCKPYTIDDSVRVCDSTCSAGGNPTPSGTVFKSCIFTGASANQAANASTFSTTPATEADFVIPTLSVNIPTVSLSESVTDAGGEIEVNWLAEYITGVYIFLLSIGAIFAVIWIMIAGLQYITSPGGGEVKKAQEKIKGAVTGLVLLMSVYLILFIINPNLTSFGSLRLQVVKSLPLESAEVTFGSGGSCAEGNLFGNSTWQDCMLNTFGKTEAEVKSHLVDVQIGGQTFKVHELVADDFRNAAAAIESSGVLSSFDLTSSSAGGTFNWRCNRNSTSSLSAHSFGTAIDFRPETNPNCPAACFTGGTCSCLGGSDCETICRSSKPYDLPQQVVSAFTGNNFSWGGNWSGLKDYMHFHSTKYCSR
jgi:hypothetical protein